MLTSLVIGDPHFKASAIHDGIKMIETTVSIAKARAPSFIVILGDILDTHEVVRIEPLNLATFLLEELSKIAPTYLLIGNHDLINNSQFLTNKHAFNSFKRWKNVFIIDKPTILEIQDSKDEDRLFIFCPYTPPGRFHEALDQIITDGYTWDLADAIFAHQEFEGCKMNQITSNKGDSWDSDYPTVISGHIHSEQIVGTNIFYPGSPVQHGFGDDSDKRIWLINWEPPSILAEEDPYQNQGFSVEKIDLCLPSKKIMHKTIEEIRELETDDSFIEKIKKALYKIELTGPSDQIKAFRQSRFFNKLSEIGVRFAFHLLVDTVDPIVVKTELSFREVLRDVVSKRSVFVQAEYEDLFQDHF